MKIDFFDGVTLLATLVGGLFCLVRGLKAKKVEETKQLSILYVLMAICAFSSSLGILVRAYSSSHTARIVLVFQAIIGGVWLGIFLTMRILGYFKPLKKC